jgi:hypothetical protein
MLPVAHDAHGPRRHRGREADEPGRGALARLDRGAASSPHHPPDMHPGSTGSTTANSTEYRMLLLPIRRSFQRRTCQKRGRFPSVRRYRGRLSVWGAGANRRSAKMRTPNRSPIGSWTAARGPIPIVATMGASPGGTVTPPPVAVSSSSARRRASPSRSCAPGSTRRRPRPPRRGRCGSGSARRGCDGAPFVESRGHDRRPEARARRC